MRFVTFDTGHVPDAVTGHRQIRETCRRRECRADHGRSDPARNCEHAPLAKGRRNEHRKSFRAGDFRVCYSRARPALILQAMFPCRGCGPHHSGFEGSAFVRASLGRNVFEASPKKPRANPALALMAPALCRRRALISQLEMQVPRHLSYKSVAIRATDHAAMAAWHAAASGACQRAQKFLQAISF